MTIRLHLHKVLSIAFALASPAFAAQAAEPAAPTSQMHLERAGMSGLGNQLRLYRVPVQVPNGQKALLDIDLAFNFNDQGQLVANFNAAESPKLAAMEFIPGVYDDGRKNRCVLGVSPAKGGRVVGGLSCANEQKGKFSVNWVSGDIAGHPYQAELAAAKVDKVPGADYVAWGKSSCDMSYCDGNFAYGNHPASVHQAGSILSVSTVNGDGTLRGTWTFTLIERQ